MELRREALQAVGQYVEVFGRLTCKTFDINAYEMHVYEIEVFPPVEELPSLESLQGVAAEGSRGRPSEDFVYALRKAWDA